MITNEMKNKMFDKAITCRNLARHIRKIAHIEERCGEDTTKRWEEYDYYLAELMAFKKVFNVMGILEEYETFSKTH